MSCSRGAIAFLGASPACLMCRPSALPPHVSLTRRIARSLRIPFRLAPAIVRLNVELGACSSGMSDRVQSRVPVASTVSDPILLSLPSRSPAFYVSSLHPRFRRCWHGHSFARNDERRASCADLPAMTIFTNWSYRTACLLLPLTGTCGAYVDSCLRIAP